MQAALGDAALEALHAAAAIHQLLPARVEGVAIRADLDMQLLARRARDELVAACAAHVGLDVAGMDLRLHRRPILAVGGGPAAAPLSRRSPASLPRRAAGPSRAGPAAGTPRG